MINVALLGNPNVGKTTVFNILTGSKQYVGNWPGVTIEKKEGFISEDIKIVDLPGIYAMDTFSNEEKVSKQFLEEGDVDLILNIVDASSLDRNLYLTTQLMQYNKPIVLLLNMIDVAEAKGIHIDAKKLEKELGVKVVPIIAKKKEGLENIENDIKSTLSSSFNYRKDFGNELNTYKEIEKILSKSMKSGFKNKESISSKIDNIILNPILAYPIFIAALLILFKFTFDWVGGPLQELTETLIDTYLAVPADALLANSSPWFHSLIVKGLIGGLGGALPFFPLIFVLFLGMSFFEDSGYMARTAFLMDNVMKKVGLSGKAFIPMIMGFGCASPAIMATRTLESEKDRKITALISPLMTCGAKLPVYALFVSIFFSKNAAIVTTSLYLLGIVVAIIIALVLNKTVYKTEVEPFVLELPEYKLPTINGLLKNTWNKAKGFLIKVCTIMFAMSVVIWMLSSFNFQGFTDNIDHSFLASLGHLIAPIFAPLGFGDWRAGISVLTGISAKEVVISTMEIVYGDLNTVLPQTFTAVTAYGFLVFSALYTPCIAALSTMRKEYGNKMMIISATYQFAVAWVAAFIVKIVGSLLFEGAPASSIIELAIGGIIIAIALLILYKNMKSKSNGCSGCSGCSSQGACPSSKSKIAE
ncbi:ferrous iron transport protein B [[Clostridium] sordellii]|uniref:ferrous iron transport protein B n=1 Tax=Paraclostridium sordellii TaxID=1505 RepID=UPI0005DE7D8C|nr:MULTISPECIES: ferrous iron transport protein B [Paeniclostridium]MBS6022994.1 ferrous iron transport protein B [Paeniclostridium sordellii]MBW4863354.1 ferrous iron transport protein B [Paeniclostridium sp.]MBW4873769.1 ferrous iron transport protein B [Paeniclostridium sp.]MBX9182185.1 ferrous iron transport protein B [Paeniclostridium sordellii]MCH1964834.1 ferrous iron transport protein B [Paeniclostridium sordellii]